MNTHHTGAEYRSRFLLLMCIFVYKCPRPLWLFAPLYTKGTENHSLSQYMPNTLAYTNTLIISTPSNAHPNFSLILLPLVKTWNPRKVSYPLSSSPPTTLFSDHITCRRKWRVRNRRARSGQSLTTKSKAVKVERYICISVSRFATFTCLCCRFRVSSFQPKDHYRLFSSELCYSKRRLFMELSIFSNY